MKVLFDHPYPFLLAHGGHQIQIEQTASTLRSCGVDAEFLRWWDDAQEAPIIHFFGRPGTTYLRAAQSKGIKVVFSELLGAIGSRPGWLRGVQKVAIAAGRRWLPGFTTIRFGWDAFQLADACIALTPWEAHLMADIFGAPPAKIHVIPNGVEEVFLNSAPTRRGEWLVCTGTINRVKRVLEVAEAAVIARTPVWFIGKPYSPSDPYVQRFLNFVQQHPQIIRYEGPVQDRQALAKVYREARGFVLLSAWESLSLAALEASACECPLLLSDLPWARWFFRDSAAYCRLTASRGLVARELRHFYNRGLDLPTPARPLSWPQVAQQLAAIYKRLLNTSS